LWFIIIHRPNRKHICQEPMAIIIVICYTIISFSLRPPPPTPLSGRRPRRAIAPLGPPSTTPSRLALTAATTAVVIIADRLCPNAAREWSAPCRIVPGGRPCNARPEMTRWKKIKKKKRKKRKKRGDDKRRINTLCTATGRAQKRNLDLHGFLLLKTGVNTDSCWTSSCVVSPQARRFVQH